MRECITTSYFVSCFIHIVGKLGFVSFIVQSSMCANDWYIMQVVFVGTQIITIIMRNYLKALSFLDTCQVYSVECVFKIKSILSVIFYAIYVAGFFNWSISLSIIMKTYQFNLIIAIKSETWIINQCWGLGNEIMVCTLYLALFLIDYKCMVLRWWQKHVGILI